MTGPEQSISSNVRIRRTFTTVADAIERRTSRNTGRKLRQLIWPKKFSHMREVAGSVSFEPDPAHGWKMHGRQTGHLAFKGLSAVKNTSQHPLLIVGSGPSAKNFDWGSLRPETRIVGVNGSPKLIGEAGLKPNVYVAIDPDFFEFRMDMVVDAIRRTKLVFLGYEGTSRLAVEHPEVLREHCGKCIMVENVNRHYGRPSSSFEELRRALKQNDRLHSPADSKRIDDIFSLSRIGWSSDPAYGLFPARTVVFAAMQIAQYLGSREIALIGVDFTDSSRAYQEVDPRPSKIMTDFDQSIKPAICFATEIVPDTAFINLSPISRLREIASLQQCF